MVESEIAQTNRQIVEDEALKRRQEPAKTDRPYGHEPEVVRKLREKGYVFEKLSPDEMGSKRNPI